MTKYSPFADYHNKIFSKASPKEQEVYLKKFYRKHGGLRDIFGPPINPEIKRLDILIDVLKKLEKLFLKVVKYDWSVLFDVAGTPESYQEDFIKLLEEKFTGEKYFPIKPYFSTGHLLKAVQNLQIIEHSLNFDWTKAKEPAKDYGDVVAVFIAFKFHDFISHIEGHDFSVDQIKTAILLAEHWRNASWGLF